MSTRKTDRPGAWLDEEVERIRNRKDLSDQGRLAHIGRAYKQAKAEADKHRHDSDTAWKARHESLLRPLMAPRTHSAEWRQLREEALAVKDPETMRRRLEAALITGDDLEARAYGAAALDRAMGEGPDSNVWVDIVNTWGQSSKAIDDQLTELSEHRATKPSVGQRLLNQAGVSLPTELRKNPQWERLLDVADSDDRSDLTAQARKAADDMAITFRQPSSYPA